VTTSFISPISATRARKEIGSPSGVGRRQVTCREAVAHQMWGSLPIFRSSASCAAAMAVHAEWQSIKVAMIPPLITFSGPAAWYS